MEAEDFTIDYGNNDFVRIPIEVKLTGAYGEHNYKARANFTIPEERHGYLGIFFPRKSVTLDHIMLYSCSNPEQDRKAIKKIKNAVGNYLRTYKRGIDATRMLRVEERIIGEIERKNRERLGLKYKK